MFKNFSVSVRLLVLVICISLVSLVVGLIGLNGMTQAIASFKFVNSDHLVHLRDLKIISDQYTLNVIDTTIKVRSKQMSWADAQTRLANARQTVKDKWAAHPTDDFVGEEKKLVTSIEAGFEKLEVQLNALQSLLENKDREELAEFSEKQLLIVGISSVIAGSLIASMIGVTFDGLIDVHLYPEITFLDSLKENSILIILITLLLFGFGKIINSKTRFIDILNSSLLFRIPFYISALLTSIPVINKIEEEVMKNINSLDKINLETTDLIGILVISILSIVLLIYAITLLFQGFKTATNAKKAAHYVIFGVLILVGEVLSKIILSLI